MIITLTTDFGLTDPYVGVMKGAILTIHPDANIVDLTHGIAPHDIEGAAFLLKSAYAYFPRRTIHVVIVDPGVGSERAILAVEAGEHVFLAPDNGVLKYVFAAHPDHRVWRVTNHSLFRDFVSATFHGRDIFAPLAAHLSKGLVVRAVGEPFAEYERGVIRRVREEENRITGEVVSVDRFGNGITNIVADALIGREVESVRVNLWEFDRISDTYSDTARGESLVLVGSGGTLEISVRQGNAKEKMKFQIGDEVVVTFKKKDFDD